MAQQAVGLVALATEVVILATLAYNLVGENTVEWDEVALPLCFVVFPILLLLPKVRKFYRKGTSGQLSPP